MLLADCLDSLPFDGILCAFQLSRRSSCRRTGARDAQVIMDAETNLISTSWQAVRTVLVSPGTQCGPRFRQSSGAKAAWTASTFHVTREWT